MKPMRTWAKFPTAWIERKGLRDFRWTRGQGANEVAALMILAALTHHADGELGLARLTYDELSSICRLSRAKIAAGLTVLESRKLVERAAIGRSTFQLIEFCAENGWAKLPARPLYRNGVVIAFQDMKLRHWSELEALKLYFLFASRRDRKKNVALISYDKITEYAAIPRERIRTALSFLVTHGLVHTERIPRDGALSGLVGAYRLTHLDSHVHAGTSLKTEEFFSERSAAESFSVPF